MARANGKKFERWSGEFNSLHTATQSNNDELVKLLIARGADVNVLADRGYTALSYAVSNGNVELAVFSHFKRSECKPAAKASSAFGSKGP